MIQEYKKVQWHIKGIPSQTRLTNRIVTGIIGLYNTNCTKNKVQDSPTCLPWIEELAIKLPRSRRTNTFLRFKGSNEEINERNRPLI